jgi:dihydrofolate reductase
VEGDAVFPPLDVSQWRLASTETHAADEKNEFAHRFEIYDRATS